MLKLIYLARRKPGFTFDEFVRRWRRHGALGMSQPIWRHARGYVQAEPLQPPPLAGAAEDYDAVACFMLSEEMYAGMTDADMEGAMQMAEDELETFSAPIPTTSLWVSEEHIRRGELGGITAFLFFADADSARTIAEGARETTGLNRITLNLRDDSRGTDSNTLPYQAVVELSASSVPALAAALEAQWQDMLSASEVAVVTREAVLWDRL